MYKSLCHVAFVALALFVCSVVVQAAETPAAPAPVKVFGVTLTAAQAEQFKAMMVASEPAKKAIRENAALSEAEKRTQMMAVYENIKAQLKAILTPEQIAQMEQAPATPPAPAPVKIFGVTLTQAQAEQFKAINAAAEPAKKAIRENAALSEADKRAQMAAIYENIKAQLKAILTPEQVKAMETAPAPPAPAPVKVFGVTLTAAQAEQFKAMMVASEPAKKAIRENAALSEAEKRAQMAAVYENIKAQLKAILTPEQIAQMEKATTEPAK